MVKAERLHWEILTVCIHRKAAFISLYAFPCFSMLFHTFPCIFIFILWEWVYYCGIYLASLTYLSHTKDTKMRQVTNEEFLAFNYFLFFLYAL